MEKVVWSGRREGNWKFISVCLPGACGVCEENVCIGRKGEGCL